MADLNLSNLLSGSYVGYPGATDIQGATGSTGLQGASGATGILTATVGSAVQKGDGTVGTQSRTI
jgi:hypothetical protein